jgi:Cupin-like domain
LLAEELQVVDRRAHLSPEMFQREYESGCGRPVVVTDAVEKWPARYWSFRFFKERYGSDTVIVADTLGRPTIARKVSLSDFVDYIETPEQTALGQLPTPTPLYMNSYSPFVAHPELLQEFTDPYFLTNQYRTLQGPAADWYNQGFGWVFIGPAGTVTPLHVDLFGTHAWLAQITGRKRCWLFAPSDAPYLYDGKVNPLKPDLQHFPAYAEARPIELVLEPGEVLFIPTGWLHFVVALEKSITLTFNFVDASNFSNHILAMARDLPYWARKVDTPAMRQALGIRWNCKDWTNSCEI